ncbi:MAG: hypothetical protein QM655_11165 [Nocardioidaceae bacterium]
MIANALVLAAETAHEEGGVNPWVVGVGIFVVLLALLAGLLIFAGGRDHS